MSFGWSVGDIVSAIEVLYNVGKALKDLGEVDQKYRETSLFLESLAATLDRVKASEASLQIRDYVDALMPPVKKFSQKLKKRFEDTLGNNEPKRWQGKLYTLEKRVRYALFDKVDVQEFKNDISVPLQMIQAVVGLECFVSLSALQSNLSALQPAGISDIERAIERSLIQYRSEREKSRETKRSRDVLEWVYPRGSTPMMDVYKDFHDSLLGGSCEWLFRTAQFRGWLYNPEASLLWITGIPGAGKTCLATRVIERLEYSEIMAYYFCDTNDSARCEFLNIVRYWIWQFLDQDKSKIDKVASVRDRGAPPAEATMINCLDHLVSSSDEQKRVVILDGLDECPSGVRRKLCSQLVHLADRAKVLLFSRKLDDISDALESQKAAAKFDHFHISSHDTADDLTNFLEASVKEKLGRLPNQALEIQIIDSLRAAADGMFQWAVLMIEDLAQPGKICEEDYLEILQDLPKGIDALYGRILNGLYESRHSGRSQKLLQWIVCSRRPLTLKEVGEVLVLGNDHSRSKNILLRDLSQTVRQLCGTLVEVKDMTKKEGNFCDVEQSSVVTLIHASAKDFLLDQSRKGASFGKLLVESGEAHTQIAQGCLAAICDENAGFMPRHISRRSKLQEQVDDLSSFSLMNYAVMNWFFHLTFSKENRALSCYTRRLYTSRKNTIRWLQLYLWIRRQEAGSGSSTILEDCMWHLQLALRKTLTEDRVAFKDWLAHLQGPPSGRLIRWNSFLDTNDILDFLSPVHIAAHFDFDDFVEEYLNSGGDVNIRAFSGLSPLCLAARGDSVKTTKVLLRAGAETNLRGISTSPLYLALNHFKTRSCHPGPYDVVRLLLNAGADALRGISTRPLYLALNHFKTMSCHPGPYDVVRLLLNAGADAYSTREDIENVGQSILLRACRISFPSDSFTLQLVDLLLAHGAKGNLESSQSDHGHDGPLQFAAQRRSAKLVDLLLRNGANCESRCSIDNDVCNGRRAAFLLANCESRCSIGSDVCNGHRTALLLACCIERPNMEVIRVLLKAGASIEAKCHDGRTALHMAAAHPVDLAELLLTYGAQVNFVSADGSLPIHEAVREHNIPVLEALVENGSQLDAKDGRGLSPLAIALEEGFDDATELLIRAGAQETKRQETASRPTRTNTLLHEAEPGYSPRDKNDQFSAFRLLLRPGIGIKLPKHVVFRILDLAEYWVKSVVSRDEAITVDEDTAKLEPTKAYLQTARIAGRRENPVQKVRFVIRGHDQGWSDEPNYGTSTNSWTWFDIQIVKRSGRLVDFGDERRLLTRNVYAQSETTEFDIVYANHPGYRKCEWIDWLKPGDQLGITVLAVFTGWINCIESAQIEVFSTYLPRVLESPGYTAQAAGDFGFDRSLDNGLSATSFTSLRRRNYLRPSKVYRLVVITLVLYVFFAWHCEG